MGIDFVPTHREFKELNFIFVFPMSSIQRILIPMRSAGQFYGGENGGPETYMWNISGKLGKIQSTLHWHMFDLCSFHQVMYAEISRKIKQLDEQYSSYKQLLNENGQNLTEEDFEWRQYQNSQVNDSFIAKDQELARIKSFSDEFSVIGLWATAERYLGEVFSLIEHHQTGLPINEVKCPYRWDDFIVKFAAKSISLETLNGYQDADECRALNNAIKHNGYVSDKLASYAYFTPHHNTQLTKIDFEMQRYANGVFNFLGSLIEAGNRLLDPLFVY